MRSATNFSGALKLRNQPEVIQVTWVYWKQTVTEKLDGSSRLVCLCFLASYKTLQLKWIKSEFLQPYPILLYDRHRLLLHSIGETLFKWVFTHLDLRSYGCSRSSIWYLLDFSRTAVAVVYKTNNKPKIISQTHHFCFSSQKITQPELCHKEKSQPICAQAWEWCQTSP